MRRTLQHLRTDVPGKAPQPQDLLLGEIAINYSKDAEKIYIKNSQQEIVPFATEKYLDSKIAGYSKFSEYISGFNTVITVSNLPVTKRCIIANITKNETLTISGNIPDGQELHILITNISASAVTVALPNVDPFISLSGDVLYLQPNETKEVNILKLSTKNYLRTS